MTTSVTTGYSSPSTRAHGTLDSAKSVRPHHSDQPMCMDGIAAYWLETVFRSPDAIEPHVWWTTTVSTKSWPFISRGGASGKR